MAQRGEAQALAPVRHQVTYPPQVVEEVPAGVVHLPGAEVTQERQRRPVRGGRDGFGQLLRLVAGDQVSGVGDRGHRRVRGEA
ncbi:hypothetical protein GCM10029964_029770 [Kibdelosporangium lantanae]